MSSHNVYILLHSRYLQYSPKERFGSNISIKDGISLVSLAELTRDSVLQSIEEFDRLGRDAFLEKYGFGRARDYLLVMGYGRYDSKALAGVAHGYLPDRRPLAAEDFSGGDPVIRKLTSLGFTVTGPTDIPPPGTVLTNNEIAKHFSVGVMGGMRRNTREKLLVLISDPFKGIYQDRWEGDVLHYTGMGPTGDQILSYSQNRTLSESRENQLIVHLLESREHFKYTYLGQVDLVGDPYREDQVDEQGQIRKVWMFPIRLKQPELVPLPTKEELQLIEDDQARRISKLSMDALRVSAAKAPKRATAKAAQVLTFIRNASVAEYVKRLANGLCDLCAGPAPFNNKQKEPYLESHHIVWLAHGGDDTIENTVALCPNCHRRMHILDDRRDRLKLKQLAETRVTIAAR